MVILGFIAGALTGLAFVPQVYKTFTTKRMDDFSWGLLILYFSGLLLWFIYGILKKDSALIFANCISLLMATSLIAAKIMYGKKA